MTFPRIMGIVNVTPDSFSDGGLFHDRHAAIDHALSLIAQGANILDVGGESTRPGAEPVSIDAEIERVVPVIEGIRAHNTDILISVDTMKAGVAYASVAAGASIVNDVTAGRFDPEMLPTVAQLNVPYIAMHMQGAPRTMQDAPMYDDVVAEVQAFLIDRVESAHSAGIREVYVDVGIGFGKTLKHNLALLQNLNVFGDIGAGQLLGISRKRFLGMLTGIDAPEERDGPTALVHALLMTANVSIVRVHNVAMVKRVMDLLQ